MKIRTAVIDYHRHRSVLLSSLLLLLSSCWAYGLMCSLPMSCPIIFIASSVWHWHNQRLDPSWDVGTRPGFRPQCTFLGVAEVTKIHPSSVSIRQIELKGDGYGRRVALGASKMGYYIGSSCCRGPRRSSITYCRSWLAHALLHCDSMHCEGGGHTWCSWAGIILVNCV